MLGHEESSMYGDYATNLYVAPQRYNLQVVQQGGAAGSGRGFGAGGFYM